MQNLNEANQSYMAKSLVIIDELGGQQSSNASVSVNFALMWSICEYLLSVSNCLTIVSTHNHLLNNLTDTYYNTKLLEIEL